MSLEEDLTVLIDYKKYQEHVYPRRVQRQVTIANNSSSSIPLVPFPLPFPYSQSNSRPTQFQRDYQRHDSNDCKDRGIFSTILNIQNKKNYKKIQIHRM